MVLNSIDCNSIYIFIIYLVLFFLYNFSENIIKLKVAYDNCTTKCTIRDDKDDDSRTLFLNYYDLCCIRIELHPEKNEINFLLEYVISLSSNETPWEMKGKTDDSNSIDDDSRNNGKGKRNMETTKMTIEFFKRLNNKKESEAIATGN